jgi:hypothetical protein
MESAGEAGDALDFGCEEKRAPGRLDPTASVSMGASGACKHAKIRA